MFAHTDHKMFLHLLTPQTKPARPPGKGRPLGERGALPPVLQLLPLATSGEGTLVKEKVLLWKRFLTISLLHKNQPE